MGFFRNGKFLGFLEMGTLGFCRNHEKFCGFFFFFFRDEDFVILLKSWETLWVFYLGMGWELCDFIYVMGRFVGFLSRDGNFVILFMSWGKFVGFLSSDGNFVIFLKKNHWKLCEFLRDGKF